MLTIINVSSVLRPAVKYFCHTINEEYFSQFYYHASMLQAFKGIWGYFVLGIAERHEFVYHKVLEL